MARTDEIGRIGQKRYGGTEPRRRNGAPLRRRVWYSFYCTLQEPSHGRPANIGRMERVDTAQ